MSIKHENILNFYLEYVHMACIYIYTLKLVYIYILTMLTLCIFCKFTLIKRGEEGGRGVRQPSTLCVRCSPSYLVKFRVNRCKTVKMHTLGKIFGGHPVI